MDRFVATGAEDGGAQNFSSVRVDDDLHEALCFPFLDGTRNAAHEARADQEPPTAGARLHLGHSDAAERRIGVEGIAGYALVQTPRFAVEQVGGDDLEIVVGRVGEGAVAVALAEGPYPRYVGSKVV